MTIQDDSGDTRPVTKTTLTKAEIMNALGFACSLKDGLTGEYNMIVRFQYAPDGELLGAEVEQRPAPAGSTGQPPLYGLQGLTLAEAAAGYGNEIVSGAR